MCNWCPASTGLDSALFTDVIREFGMKERQRETFHWESIQEARAYSSLEDDDGILKEFAFEHKGEVAAAFSLDVEEAMLRNENSPEWCWPMEGSLCRSLSS